MAMSMPRTAGGPQQDVINFGARHDRGQQRTWERSPAQFYVAGYDNAVAFYALTSIVHGTVYIVQLINRAWQPRGHIRRRAPSSTDFTEVKGTLSWIALALNANMYSYLPRRRSCGDVIINLSGSNYTQMFRPRATPRFLIEADVDPNTGDGSVSCDARGMARWSRDEWLPDQTLASSHRSPDPTHLLGRAADHRG